MDIQLIDIAEDQGIKELRDCILRLNPSTTTREKFYEILLQRYWVSEEFTHIYDTALNRLTPASLAARPIIRRIIREEYPYEDASYQTPSHREDLVTDLLNAGISWEQFSKTKPSRQTGRVILDARATINCYGGEPEGDILLLTYLRFWGEILTAIEYDTLYPRIEKLLNKKESCFYLYHKLHDEKHHALNGAEHSTVALTHADVLGKVLAKQLTLDNSSLAGKVNHALRATKKALRNKINFYKQFI